MPMLGMRLACHCPTPEACFVETVCMMPLLSESHCVALRTQERKFVMHSRHF